MRALLLTALLFVGCEDSDFMHATDQCMRKRLFDECMAHVPPGPTTTHYNDWAEVVAECDSVSRYQSQRLKSQIARECLP